MIETLYNVLDIFFNHFFIIQIGGLNQEGWKDQPLSLDKAIKLVKDVFISAAERDIYTGDGILLNIVTKDGVREESFPLRRD